MTTATALKDPTAADRARRYRARKREAARALVALEPTPLAAIAAPVTRDVTPVTVRPRWTFGAVVLIIIAFAIATLALIINGQSGWRYGTTVLAAVTFAGLSLAADL